MSALPTIVRIAKLAYEISELDEAAGICRSRAWQLIKDGKLKARKDGARIRILTRDLEAYLEQRDAEIAAAKAPKPIIPGPTCGVYMLHLRGRIVYVGRSTRLRSRLASHRSSGREFDQTQIIACDEATSIWLEKELIRTLQPTQNLLRYRRHAMAAARHIKERGLH